MTEPLDVQPEKKQKKHAQSFLFMKSLGPLILGHHPECEEFNNHIIKVGRKRLCIGCFIGYPTALLGLIFLTIFNIPTLLGSNLTLLVSFILMSFFILTPLNLTRIKTIKILQKILVGFGTSFLFWYVWLLPNPFIINLVLFIMSFGAVSALLNLYHVMGIYSTCKHCSFAGNWSTCPGFEDTNARLVKNGLPRMQNQFLKKKELFDN